MPADLGLEASDAVGDRLDYRQRGADTAVERTERALIERALAAAGQNRTHAARLLGIGRRTLLYKLKRHGL